MSERPATPDLIRAVAGFIEEQAMPALSGHAAYSARVAANVLGIVEREARLGPAAEAAERARLATLLADGDGADRDALNARLCEAIRRGDMTLATPGLLPHLRATLLNRLAIDQPRYSGYRAARERDAHEPDTPKPHAGTTTQTGPDA